MCVGIIGIGKVCFDVVYDDYVVCDDISFFMILLGYGGVFCDVVVM